MPQRSIMGWEEEGESGDKTACVRKGKRSGTREDR